MAFSAPLDIVNRGLQIIGAARVPSLSIAATATKAQSESTFAYDKLRVAELTSNLWKFATRSVILRALGVDSVLWTPAAWASGGTYSAGMVLNYTPADNGPYNGVTLAWQTDTAKSGSTTTPVNDADFHHYTGSRAIDLYDSNLSYFAGEIVLVPADYASGTTYSTNDVVADGTDWYVSLIDGNVASTPASSPAAWVLWTGAGRSRGSFGTTAGNSPVPLGYPGSVRVFLSLYNANADNPLDATDNWLNLGGTVAPLLLVWPIFAGPSHNMTSKFVYRLPNAFLKRAPTDPKANTTPYLGAFSGVMPDDWVLEGRYLTSADAGPVYMRFVADVIDVPDMDALFCEGLAGAVGEAVCEPVTQSDAKVAKATQYHEQMIRKARQVNAIEIGPIAPVENRYVLVRQ